MQTRFEMASQKTCCGCLSLRTGCFIIGGIEIIIGTVNAAVTRSPGILLFFIVPVLLIVGAEKKNRHYMWPWIILNGIGVAIVTLLVIGGAILIGYCSSVECRGSRNVKYLAIGMIAAMPAIAISIYRVYIVRCYMKSLYEDERAESLLQNTSTSRNV